jgi:hypothetical protein
MTQAVDPEQVRLIAGSGVFYPDWYSERNPDAGVGLGTTLWHYLRGGWQGGSDPGPFFSVSWYLQHSPDIQGAGIEPLSHYLVQGWREGRSPFPGFDGTAYAEAVGIAGEDVCPLVHLLARARLPLPDPEPADA